ARAGEPAGLAYVRAPDGRYHAVCLTVLSLDADGRIVELTTFVLPELFAAWGFPAVLSRGPVGWPHRAERCGSTVGPAPALRAFGSRCASPRRRDRAGAHLRRRDRAADPSRRSAQRLAGSNPALWRTRRSAD